MSAHRAALTNELDAAYVRFGAAHTARLSRCWRAAADWRGRLVQAATAAALRHAENVSARKNRRILADVRCRGMVKVLQVVACVDRNRRADPGDLKPWSLHFRRRTGTSNSQPGCSCAWPRHKGDAPVPKHQDVAEVQLGSRRGPQSLQSRTSSRQSRNLPGKGLRRHGRAACSHGLIAAGRGVTVSNAIERRLV